MLVALQRGSRVFAIHAIRSSEHSCPACGERVTLKRGKKRIAHFAHRPGSDCQSARGESLAHMMAKMEIFSVLQERGVNCDVEVPVPTRMGERRADVLITTKMNYRFAIEVQQTPISPDAVAERTAAYASNEIGVVWLPVLRAPLLAELSNIDERRINRTLVKKVVVNTFEKWVESFPGRSCWCWDPERLAVWKVRYSPHVLWKSESTWYDADGNECTTGGYEFKSKRWSDVDMWGPFDLRDIVFHPYTAKSDEPRKTGFKRCGSLIFLPKDDLGLDEPF